MRIIVAAASCLLLVLGGCDLQKECDSSNPCPSGKVCNSDNRCEDVPPGDPGGASSSTSHVNASSGVPSSGTSGMESSSTSGSQVGTSNPKPSSSGTPPSSGSTTTSSGASGAIILVGGGLRSLPVMVGDHTLRIINPRFESGARTCANNICVNGALTP